MVELANLPLELLMLIVANLAGSSLKSFSVVNKMCRAASTSELFHAIKITFSKSGFKTFEELAKSPLASCVKTLHYETSELVDPLIQHWDYFTTCIYTPQEYARDQNDFHWDLRGKEFSYKAIHSYFRGLARGQYGLLKERSDIQTFSECLPRLLNLTTIKLSFTGAKEDQLLWFTNRIYLESGDSFPIHLETVLRGMVKSQHNGIIVESIEIDGMHPYSTTTEGDILEIAGAALMHVKTFKLMGSSSLLELMSSIPLPSLRRFELANCWLAGSDLIRFLEFHQGIVQHAHFHSISLFYERFGETDRCSETLQRLLEVVSDSGNIGKLENLVILCHPQI